MAYLRTLVILALLSPLACGPGDPEQSGSASEASAGSSGDASSGDVPTTGEPTGTGGDDWTVICDGSSELRLAFVLTGGGLIDNELERALGFQYLYVLGTCEYYVLPPLTGVQWPDARTGVIDEATEEALSRAIDYGGIPALAGSYTTDGLFDGTTLLVTDFTSTVSCYGGCEQGPPAAQALWSAQTEWLKKLWDQGEPLLGALRISVVATASAPSSESAPEWPLAIDPASIAAEDSIDANFPTVRVDAEPDLSTLRALRQQYREDDLPPDAPNYLINYGFLLFHDVGGPDLFRLWIRDSLPIEDADGHIALPPPP